MGPEDAARGERQDYGVVFHLGNELSGVLVAGVDADELQALGAPGMDNIGRGVVYVVGTT